MKQSRWISWLILALSLLPAGVLVGVQHANPQAQGILNIR